MRCASVIRLVERMVAFVPRKSESKTEVAAAQVPGQVQRLLVFGPPLLLEGEDAAAYDQLLARFCAAVKPVDVIDEMLTADIVALEWEVLRWRRLKRTLMQEAALKALERFFGSSRTTLSTRNIFRVISRKFSKTTFRQSERRCWRPNVPRIPTKLTTTSVGSSSASG